MIDYDDKIPHHWYDEINKEINWDIYDEKYSSNKNVNHSLDDNMKLDKK